MKKYLLDTHIFLWWLADDPRLLDKHREIISDPETITWVSVVSAWEIIIKKQIGKLALKTDPGTIFEKSPFELLRLELNHVLRLESLPLLHRDPFDRVLIAQAQTERCVLVTTDEKIAQYNDVRVT